MVNIFQMTGKYFEIRTGCQKFVAKNQIVVKPCDNRYMLVEKPTSCTFLPPHKSLSMWMKCCSNIQLTKMVLKSFWYRGGSQSCQHIKLSWWIQFLVNKSSPIASWLIFFYNGRNYFVTCTWCQNFNEINKIVVKPVILG